VQLGAQPQQVPAVGDVGQPGGHGVPPLGLGDRELLEVERGQGEGEPQVRLVQRAGGAAVGRGVGGRELLGEQAGVDGQQHRGVEVVGGGLHVGEVGQHQRGRRRRGAGAERLAGGGDAGRDGVPVAVEQPAAGGQRRAPRGPGGPGGGGQRGLDVVEPGPEVLGVVALAGGQQAPQCSVEVTVRQGCRAGSHASLLTDAGRPAAAGRRRGSSPRTGPVDPGRPHYPRRVLQTPPTRFAYLGPEGTFAEAALRTAVAPGAGVQQPADSVPAALAAVRADEADAALVPLENSVEGSVPATMDGLVDGEPLVVTREVFLPVSFVLAARPGTALGRVRAVVSHPHALAQTARTVAGLLPGVPTLPATSTAAAARAVAEGEHDAAVCAPIAAERYGLVPLAEDVADHPGAVTRFVLVSRPGALPAPPATTRRRWSPSSPTAPARCSTCCGSSPSAGSA
jgi:prephenate dehydratase